MKIADQTRAGLLVGCGIELDEPRLRGLSGQRGEAPERARTERDHLYEAGDAHVDTDGTASRRRPA